MVHFLQKYKDEEEGHIEFKKKNLYVPQIRGINKEQQIKYVFDQ